MKVYLMALILLLPASIAAEGSPKFWTFRVNEVLNCNDGTNAQLTYDLAYKKSGELVVEGWGTDHPTALQPNLNTLDFICTGSLEFTNRRSATGIIDECNIQLLGIYTSEAVTGFKPGFADTFGLQDIVYYFEFSPSFHNIVGHGDPRNIETLSFNSGTAEESNIPRNCSRQLSGVRVKNKANSELLDLGDQLENPPPPPPVIPEITEYSITMTDNFPEYLISWSSINTSNCILEFNELEGASEFSVESNGSMIREIESANTRLICNGPDNQSVERTQAVPQDSNPEIPSFIQSFNTSQSSNLPGTDVEVTWTTSNVGACVSESTPNNSQWPTNTSLQFGGSRLLENIQVQTELVIRCINNLTNVEVMESTIILIDSP